MPGIMLSPGETDTVSQLRHAASLISLPGSLANSAHLSLPNGLPSFSRDGSVRQAAQPDLERGQRHGRDTPELPQPPVSQPPALIRPERVKAPRPLSILAPQLTLPRGWGLRVWNSAQSGRPIKLSVYIFILIAFYCLRCARREPRVCSAAEEWSVEGD